MESHATPGTLCVEDASSVCALRPAVYSNCKSSAFACIYINDVCTYNVWEHQKKGFTQESGGKYSSYKNRDEIFAFHLLQVHAKFCVSPCKFNATSGNDFQNDPGDGGLINTSETDISKTQNANVKTEQNLTNKAATSNIDIVLDPTTCTSKTSFNSWPSSVIHQHQESFTDASAEVATSTIDGQVGVTQPPLTSTRTTEKPSEMDQMDKVTNLPNAALHAHGVADKDRCLSSSEEAIDVDVTRVKMEPHDPPLYDQVTHCTSTQEEDAVRGGPPEVDSGINPLPEGRPTLDDADEIDQLLNLAMEPPDMSHDLQREVKAEQIKLEEGTSLEEYRVEHLDEGSNFQLNSERSLATKGIGSQFREKAQIVLQKLDIRRMRAKCTNCHKALQGGRFVYLADGTLHQSILRCDRCREDRTQAIEVERRGMMCRDVTSSSNMSDNSGYQRDGDMILAGKSHPVTDRGESAEEQAHRESETCTGIPRNQSGVNTEELGDDHVEVKSNMIDKSVQTRKEERHFHCLVCQMAFTRKHNMERHLRICTGKRPSYTSARNMISSSNHEGESTAHGTIQEGLTGACNSRIRSRIYTDESGRYHVESQSGETRNSEQTKIVDAPSMKDKDGKPFCNKCQRTFSRNYNLARHVIICTGKIMRRPSKSFKVHEKKAFCNKCQKGFCRSFNLYRHQRTCPGKNNSILTSARMNVSSLNPGKSTEKQTLQKDETSSCVPRIRSGMNLEQICDVHVEVKSDKSKPEREQLQSINVYSDKNSLEGDLKLGESTEKQTLQEDETGTSSSIIKSGMNPEQIGDDHVEVTIDELKEREQLQSINVSSDKNSPVGDLGFHVVTRGGMKRFRCNLCQKGFSRKHNVLRHLKFHTGERPHSCSMCRKTFSHEWNMKAHYRAHHPGEITVGSRVTTGTSSKNSHADSQGNVQTVDKPFVCSICAKAFSLKSVLKTHMRKHTGEKPFRCNICSKGFTKESSRKRHMKFHTGERPFSCNVCKKSFSHEWNMKTHFRAHHPGERTVGSSVTDEKPFVCSICAKAFSLKSVLKTHMRTHTGEKPFRCSICGKGFTKESSRKRHMKFHTGERPFSCNVCMKSFSYEWNMKAHCRAHHPGEGTVGSSVTDEKPFVCSICGKAFSLKYVLTCHMRRHTGEKPFTCSICSKGFTQESSRKRHMMSHTGERPFSCSICTKTFIQECNMKTHFRVHHFGEGTTCNGSSVND